jgi:ribose transport system substrate-binding protein
VDTEAVSAADKELQAFYAGTHQDPPATTSPVKPGAKVFVIGGDQSASATQLAVESVVKAGEIAGWDVSLWDGKGQSTQQLAGIRTAVSQGANAIFMYAVDCASVQAGLQEAKDAGIIVVTAQAFDCSEVDPSAPSLITHQVDYVAGGPTGFSKAWGAAQATYLISKLGGEVKLLNIVETDYRATVVQDEGFRARLEECGSCEILDTIEFTTQDFGPPLQQKVAQALQRNPDVNATLVAYDALLTGGVLGGIRDAGMTDKITVAGGEGAPEAVNLLKQGQVAAEFGIPTAWEGWAGADAINRLLAGDEPQPSGIGIQVVDLEHNMPEGDRFTSSVDFQGIYTEAFQQAAGK